MGKKKRCKLVLKVLNIRGSLSSFITMMLKNKNKFEKGKFPFHFKQLSKSKYYLIG
jgi:hypothetical protein